MGGGGGVMPEETPPIKIEMFLYKSEGDVMCGYVSVLEV